MASKRQQDAFRTQLREAGLRVTGPRMAVLGLFAGATRPLSHGELADMLEGQSIDRATVFRNLQDMAEVGILRRKDLGDHVWRYELASGEGAHGGDEHPHFVCSECGSVSCLAGAAISIKAPRSAPAMVRKGHFEVQLRGLCDACHGSRIQRRASTA
jgi:Fur family ferric uptake transcriptional regulator